MMEQKFPFLYFIKRVYKKMEKTLLFFMDMDHMEFQLTQLLNQKELVMLIEVSIFFLEKNINYYED